MNEQDVIHELLDEVRSLCVAVEHGQNTDRPLTRKEAAEYLQVHEDTVYAWAKGGLLSFSKLGDGQKAPMRFFKDDLEEFARSRRRISCN